MKTTLILLIALSLGGCAKKLSTSKTAYKYKYMYEVTYTNGETETIESFVRYRFNDGCMENSSLDALRCGVRKMTTITNPK